jgi:hypothetical protein
MLGRRRVTATPDGPLISSIKAGFPELARRLIACSAASRGGGQFSIAVIESSVLPLDAR